MSEKANDGLQDWLRGQQQFWQAYQDMAKQGGSAAGLGASTPTNPWAQGLEQWWKAATPQAADPVSQMFQQVVNMGKNFTDLAQQGMGAAQPANKNVIEEWLKSMQAGFHTWAEQLQAGTATASPDIPGLNKTTMDAWSTFAEQMFSSGSFSAAGTPNFEDSKQAFDRVLSTPALGPGREHQQQQQLQLIAQRMREYQEAELVYKMAFAQLGERAVTALRQRLQEIDERSQDIDGLRGFYELWVEVNETLYAEFAMTDEYQVIYADLVNSLMALRKEMNVLQEKTYKAMNLPTRSEINALQLRLHQQRRENRQLRDSLQALSKQLENKAPSKPKVKLKAHKAKQRPAADDLSKIKGVGPRMNERLNLLGIQSFAELAAMQAEELKALDGALNAGGRVLHEQWAKQAASLLS